MEWNINSNQHVAAQNQTPRDCGEGLNELNGWLDKTGLRWKVKEEF